MPSSTTPDRIDAAVLGLVLARHPSPVHEDEIGRAFDDVDWRASVRQLADDGLLHRCERLLFASRAAARAEALLE